MKDRSDRPEGSLLRARDPDVKIAAGGAVQGHAFCVFVDDYREVGLFPFFANIAIVDIRHNADDFRIGCDVGLAQNCAIYSYDHGVKPNIPISQQPLESKGPVVIGDHVWLGTGVIVLSGVHIGAGAVIASGAVVTRDIADGAIAAGVPARVVKMRKDL